MLLVFARFLLTLLILFWFHSWASEENEVSEEECLQEGQPAPDLATVKDFIRYYIYSAKGMLTLRPTMPSVKNFAERFFAGFTRVIKTVFDKKDTEDVYHVRKNLQKNLLKETELNRNSVDWQDSDQRECH